MYIHNIAMPGPEANTVNVAKMCNAFAANGCDVTLAALPGVPKETLSVRVREHYGVGEEFDIIALPRAGARPVVAALTGAFVARQRGVDLVYTRAPHVALAACLAGVPAVLEAHADFGAFSVLGRTAFIRAVRHPLLLNLVVISRALGEHFRKELPRTPTVIVAPDGADAKPRALSRTPRDRLAIGFAGRFHRGKGLELIAQIAPLCPWADFHIVGGDVGAAAHILTVSPPANLIFHGAASHARVAGFIDDWDVALAPYQLSVVGADGADIASWMSPLKIFEYMASGKAILASDLPVLKEILSDGDNALLLPPDEPRAWAAALHTLRDQPRLRDNLGASALNTFIKNHTWTERARHILQSIGHLTCARQSITTPIG